MSENLFRYVAVEALTLLDSWTVFREQRWVTNKRVGRVLVPELFWRSASPSHR